MYTIKNPTSQQVRNVINVFKSVLPLARRQESVNMRNAVVRSVVAGMIGCGTVLCHGGWFALGKGLHKPFVSISFREGVEAMSNELGMGRVIYVSLWAANNPKIWGNIYGVYMFCGKLAFIHDTKRPLGASTLQHIIDHWEEVYERLVILENQVEISEPPITAEKLVNDLEGKTRSKA